MIVVCFVVFFFKQKTAYEMRISDWSSDVCSSDLFGFCVIGLVGGVGIAIDTSVAYNVKSRLSAAVDAAALAGARAFASPTRDADIEKFFEANSPAGYLDWKRVV